MKVIIMDAYKAKFILNALEDGWTVKQSSSGAYKFTKSTKCFDGPTLERVKHEQFSKRFIRQYTPEAREAAAKACTQTEKNDKQ